MTLRCSGPADAPHGLYKTLLSTRLKYALRGNGGFFYTAGSTSLLLTHQSWWSRQALVSSLRCSATMIQQYRQVLKDLRLRGQELVDGER